MTPADFTLSTPGANLLSVLPPRRRTGARVEPFISGVIVVERKKRLRSRNIRAGGGRGIGLGLPIPIEPHKGTGAVERFHIAEPKGSTSIRDRLTSSRPRCIEKYLCTLSGSLIRKIELGWGSTMGAHVFWLSRILLGGTESKKGRGATMHSTSRPCLRGTVERATHECCRVGRANNSNAFGLFFEQESQRYLTFTMIRTPSYYGRARGDLSSI
ncbi:hypothetical protein Lal_00019825 [Lupinus albus]|nr:hypothetical protein Lal_00019825 [Lupinus albus]